MALIKCGECSKEISDKASSCPQCGNPINTRPQIAPGHVPLQTVQATSKSLKLQLILAGTATAISLMIFFIQWSAVEGYPAGSAILLGISTLWLIVTKFRVWWHHD